MGRDHRKRYPKKIMATLKNACIGCGRTDIKTTKEHIFPKWLIERTGTDNTGIKWICGYYIPASAATIPLCKKCNHDFGEALESPVSRIFYNLESGIGISDNEAEVLIRWLWKFEGLAWHLFNPIGTYTRKYSLRERVLQPIDEIRGELVLAISLISEIDPDYGDAPMGIDSFNELNAIFVAGVFLKIAIMVLLNDFTEMMPENFSLYRLSSNRGELADAKFFYPKIGFQNDTEAVNLSQIIGRQLSKLHDDVFHHLKK